MAARVSIEITGADELAERLLAIDERLGAKPAPLFDAVADAWLSEFQRIIREQDPPSGPWQDLSPWSRRERKRAGYGEDRPMLQRRGDLLAHILRQPGSDNEVVVGVGANFEPAPMLQFGGVTRLGTVIPARPFIALSAEVIEDTMALVLAHYFPEPGSGASDG